ncbi:PRP24 [Candida jiufengensis]|uniref:PRP24 n=1 Tax=Candida jiufengensis TaxID=497108 RepID=UPI0022240B50|nr:PRP24 [Candida jiufengensis]KAI5950942.1 PRP24 [Candida jiufengensis]
MTDELKLIVDQFESSINKNPYACENYDKVLNELSVLQDRSLIINKVYTEKIKYFKLRQSELNNWLFEIRSIIDEEERSRLEFKFYELIIDDYSTVSIWTSTLRLAGELYQNNNMSQSEYRSLIFKALYTCGHDFQNGYSIWELGLDVFYQNFIKTNEPSDLDLLVKLHLKRLSFPLAQLDECFQEFSSLISNHKSQNYDELIQMGNKVYTSTKKKIPQYERYEVQLIENPNDPEIWIEYMENVYKYSSGGNLPPVQAIFARATQNELSFSNNWQQIWISLLYIIYSSEKATDETINTFLHNYIRAFPNSCNAYAESIKNCVALGTEGNQHYLTLEDRMNLIELKSTSEYSDWKLVALATIQFKYQGEQAYDGFDSIDHLLKSMVEYALKNEDPLHSVEKLAISIYLKLNEPKRAVDVIMSLFTTFCTESDVWIYGLQLMMKLDLNLQTVRSLFMKALTFDLDFPEKITDQWLLFEQVDGDLDSYRQAVVYCNNSVKKIMQSRQVKAVLPVERKRNHDVAEESQRSREEFSVQVNNLSQGVTKEDVKTFFSDCGDIRDINLVEFNGEKKAVIEFSNELEVFSAITRSHKILGANEILVTRVQKTLLFVNNYPSSFSQLQVKEMFESVGPLVSIRFPSQLRNRTRRFCYIQFVNHENAQKAIALYDGLKYKDGNFNRESTWVVKYSEPQENKDRNSPMSERKIRVTNISFSITEDELKNEFSEFGEIDSISLPKAVFDTKNRRMKQNGGIAIIAFKNVESVDDALSKDGFNIKDRAIKVSKLQIQNNLTPEDFDQLKSVGLTDINSSLNQYQIKNHLEKNYGRVNKILLLPHLYSALIEFDDIKDCGKIGLNGGSLEIDNYLIQITSKQEITNLIISNTNTRSTGNASRANAKKSPMVPTSIKRRKI